MVLIKIQNSTVVLFLNNLINVVSDESFTGEIGYKYMIIIIALALFYTIKVFRYSKDTRIIFVPLFKVINDILTIIGFWKGFITKRQEF